MSKWFEEYGTANSQSCDHEFTVPLYMQAESGEWLPLVVGVACEKCWMQVFDGESVTWTGTSSRTEYVQVSW